MHFAWRVVSTRGNEYAIDVSGAQYGYHEPLILWKEYESQRVQKIHVAADFGTMKSVRDGWRSRAWNTTAHGGAVHLNMKPIGDEMDCIIKGWLQSEGTELAEMLRLEGDTYKAKSSTLLKHLEDGLKGYVRAGWKNKDLVVAVEKQQRNNREESFFVGGDGSKKSFDEVINEE